MVGLGGVGSWTVEALARCGLAQLVLIDFDHIAESNINRQVHALDSTLGQAKVEALRQRVAQIHPECEVRVVDAFVTPEDWPKMLPAEVDVVIDACDDPKAKLALAQWALDAGSRLATEPRRQLVMAGAAGGKREAARVMRGDLVHVTHDPLLAQLRQRLRKLGLIPPASGKPAACGLTCVYSTEPVSRMHAGCDMPAAGLNCQGYGSVVTVTASFGLAAADAALSWLTRTPAP